MTAVVVLLAAGVAGASPAARAAEFDHSPWDHVLKKYVNEQGRVDYGALKNGRAEFDSYIAAIAARSPQSNPQDFPTRESQLAYWINAYNGLTIQGVLENWPVGSVRKIGALPFSFFWHKKFTAGGRQMTLDNIEDILRKQLREPRIHFAIVCASNSCPRLQREAYTAQNVDRLLDEAARFYLNEPRNLRIDAARNRVTLPRIFSFYHGDFEAYVREKGISVTGQPLVDFVTVYANEANRRALATLHKPSVSHFDYDWGINDLHAPAATMKSESKGDGQ